MKKPIVIASHSGSHHADDVFGLAVLLTLHPDATVVRTRDPEVIAAADFAVDVGGVWDAAAGRFDHHQKGFTGKRDNGTVFASAGLVWLEHGRQYLRKLGLAMTPDQVEKVFAAVDVELVEHIDRADTGDAVGAPGYFGLSALVDTFNVTRQEELQALDLFDGPTAMRDQVSAKFRLDRFLQAVGMVQQLLRRLVAQLVARYVDEAQVRNAERLFGGRVLVLESPGLVWDGVVVREMPDVLFVIYPDSTDHQFQIRTVPIEVGSFTARSDLPAHWAGLRDAGLAAASGVPDAVFCHNGRFIAGAGSKAGALQMADLALQALT